MKSIGIITEDFKLYYELVAALKKMNMPFVSLSFGEEIPPCVSVVVTSIKEAAQIKFPNVVYGDDADEIIAKAQCLLFGKRLYKKLVVGIDPGERTGIAVIGDDMVLRKEVVNDVAVVGRLVQKILKIYPHELHVVKIGHGDIINRNKIINDLGRRKIAVKIVNETRTTKSRRWSEKKPKSHLQHGYEHINAAIAIAYDDHGVTAKKRYEILPTRGEIREIQRRSRLRSSGEITISEELALEVLRGKINLDEAIEEQRKKDKPAQK